MAKLQGRPKACSTVPRRERAFDAAACVQNRAAAADEIFGREKRSMGSEMTIGRKIGLCFGALVLLWVAISVSATIFVSHLRTELDHSVRDATRREVLISDLRTNVLGLRFAERGILLYSLARAPEKVEQNIQAFAQSRSIIEESIRQVRPLLVSDRGRELTNEIESSAGEYLRLQAQVPGLCASGNVRQAIDIDVEQLMPYGAQAVKAAEELSRIQEKDSDEAFSHIAGLLSSATVVAIIALFLLFGVAGLAGFVTTRGSRVLRTLTGTLESAAERIQASANQVASASNSLAQGASQQAASIEETSASAEEAATTAKQNINAADESDRLVNEADAIGAKTAPPWLQWPNPWPASMSRPRVFRKSFG